MPWKDGGSRQRQSDIIGLICLAECTDHSIVEGVCPDGNHTFKLATKSAVSSSVN